MERKRWRVGASIPMPQIDENAINTCFQNISDKKGSGSDWTKHILNEKSSFSKIIYF